MPEREGSWFADVAAARKAVDMVLPLIDAAMKDSAVGESGFLHIVIMDPALAWGAAPFEQSILLEHSVGDRQRWDADYARFARDKARVCWRTGRDGHSVRVVSPHLLKGRDCGVWGGVCVDGIVVGVSGANPWYDEAFAGCVAHCLKAVSKSKALAQPETPDLGPAGSDAGSGAAQADGC